MNGRSSSYTPELSKPSLLSYGSLWVRFTLDAPALRSKSAGMSVGAPVPCVAM